jgi:uncharacterized protein YndB with AHSA1/START domain
MTDLIERELELPAPPDAVWEALTDAAWLAHWLADEVVLDLWPGGDAHFRIGEERREGWVEEVAPPGEDGIGRLAFWWEADGEPATRVALELTRSDGGSRLRVIENRPLDVLDLVGTPLGGLDGAVGGLGGQRFGPALVVG